MALLQAAASGNQKFFFGSDSAPHHLAAKLGHPEGKQKQAAGIFTQPFCTQLVLDAFVQGCNEGVLSPERLDQKIIAGFLSEHGKKFYQEEPMSEEHVVLGSSQSVQIPNLIATNDPAVAIPPFRRGQHTRSLKWV